MSLYAILSNADPDYLRIKELISAHPNLKDAFTLKEILRVTCLSLNDRKILKKMFDGSYSDVVMPAMNFEYRSGKWTIKEIDIQRGFHQFFIKVLNSALKEGKYPLGFPVFSNDLQRSFNLTQPYSPELTHR